MSSLVLNYAHPFTEEQLERVSALLESFPEVRFIPTEVDRTLAMGEVARELADAAGLNSTEWQTLPLLINPPALTPLALSLIAELHGRCGYFPPIINIRPVRDVLPPRYEVAEIVNLQALREQARSQR